MTPIFDRIDYLHGLEPLDGALQMAIDELLLKDVSTPLLRDYQWSQPTVSIGYFGKYEEATASPLVRRPTGGGEVEHGNGLDFTYSVVVPATQAKHLNLTPRASYRAIHRVLTQVLQASGIAATMADGTLEGDGSPSCFSNPVGNDILCEGRKIAGAGQKRSRGAILHQGSVQPIALPVRFGADLAAGLARQVERIDLDPALLREAESLAGKKYRSPAWTRRR